MPYVRIRNEDDVRSRLVVGVTKEDQWLDFKRVLDSDTAELARDIAQFANASGGTLVIGGSTKGRVLAEFVNVTAPDLVMQRIDTITNDHLTPTPVIAPHAIQVMPDIVVVVVNVEPLPTLVARHSDHKRFECLIRSDESKRYMTWGEVEARMGTRDRLVRLRLEQIGSEELVAFDAAMFGSDHYTWRVTGVEDDVVRLTRYNVEVVIPLVFIDAVYRTRERTTAWILSLSCCITALSADAIRVSKERMFSGSGAFDQYRYRGLAPA